jgi:hypothetical protein
MDAEPMRLSAFGLSIAAWLSGLAMGQVVHYSVGSVQTLNFHDNSHLPAEAQSTVVPPGKNQTWCPAGRLLMSNDALRPPSPVVRGRDLSGNGPEVISTFDQPPHPEWYSYVTNDHDLVTMNDGTVVYLTGAGSIEPLSPKPVWWDGTYRGTFGPGTRSILMAWRSTDCGKSFQYAGEMDPAHMEDGSCANPQPVSNPHTGQTWDMGGSDGQLVKHDPLTDTLYLTFKCVGYYMQKKFDHSAAGAWVLTQPLNKTLVAISKNQGASWSSLGFIPGVAWWRFGVAPESPTKVAFGFANALTIGSPAAGGKFTFTAAQPAPAGSFGWTGSNWKPYNQTPRPVPAVTANVVANTLIARAGDATHLILAFPSDAGQSGGFRVFFYDEGQQQFAEGAPILPANNSKDSVVMHLTAIDIGFGPVMLYWDDIDGPAKKVTVRGRIVTGLCKYTSDFDISGSSDLSSPAGSYFYGDYRTAGGFGETRLREPTRVTLAEHFHFYPMWVDRSGTLKFADVAVTESPEIRISRDPRPMVGTVVPPVHLNVIRIPIAQWRPSPGPVELRTMGSQLPRVVESEEVEAVKMRQQRARKEGLR